MSGAPRPDPSDRADGFSERLTGDLRTLADRTGMTLKRLQRLRRHESGTGPTLSEVESLAAAMGVSRAWLAFGDPIHPYPNYPKAP